MLSYEEIKIFIKSILFPCTFLYRKIFSIKKKINFKSKKSKSQSFTNPFLTPASIPHFSKYHGMEIE